MTVEPAAAPAAYITLGEAANEYILSLKPEIRRYQEPFIRKYIEYAGEGSAISSLSGSRVESYAEAQIRTSDPAAPDRVAALKAWFQFLKKREYTTTNFGVNVRAKRTPGRSNVGGSLKRDESPIEMTADGIAALEEELKAIGEQHIDLIKAVEIARSDGDLKENAPYHAAREALAFTMNRKKQIEEAMRRAVLVEKRDADGRSAVGSTVNVTNLAEDRTFEYILVNAREANAAERKISVDSPVGKQLLGRRPGDEVAVATPRGEVKFRIDSVMHT
ncbi:MAG: GreA/GreB family elongation factor [Dehalococcoidia bacterium]